MNNQGLDNFNISGTPTFVASRTGQGLDLSKQITFTAPSLTGLKPFTCCYWFKINSSTTLTGNWMDHICFNASNGTSSSTIRCENCYSDSHKNSITANWYGVKSGSIGTAAVKDKWYHMAFATDGVTNKIYIDGVLKATSTTSSDYLDYYLTGYVRVGENNNIEGIMSDLRIYDECLSQKQIKEISKGLVAHYKLTGVGANPNLLVDAGNRSKWTYESCTRVNDTDSKVIGFSVSSANQRIYLGVTNVWNSGQKYTYSFDAKASVNDAQLDASRSIADFGSNHFLTTEWQHYSGKISSTATADAGTLSIRGKTANTTYYLKNIKLENGEEETNYIPNINDIEYTTSGYENDICTDVSGNGYNLIQNGAVVFNTDTSRYCGSSLFNGDTSCFTIPFNNMCPENIFTINVWFKKDSVGTKNYETLIGGPSGFEMDTRNNNASVLSLYMANARGGNKATNISFGEWHMVTMTRDGTKEKYYVDGEFKSEIDAVSMPTGTYYIGAWKTATQQNYYGLMSDFRIYATALSADDIKQLYQTSGLIDNGQNMYSYEFKDETGIVAYGEYPTGHTNFYDTFSRDVINDDESPTGKATKLTCTAVGTQTNRGYYFGGSEAAWSAAKSKMVNGKTYELSMYVKMNKSSNNFKMNVECASSQSQTTFSVDTKYKRLVNTFVYNSSAQYWAITNYSSIFEVDDSVYIHSIKIREVDAQPKLSKRGIFSSSGMEENEKSKIYKSSIEANNFIEI